ncbi:DUF6549 family protein [uncultured Draconibacterium sp.]|uniref:DUF6549 family protein n=1 Tax=uncultured Draconibacterium sp. TaxID=1573823 RepID=UPI0032165E01
MKLKAQITILLVLIGSLLTLSALYRAERNERKRIEGNQATLLETNSTLAKQNNAYKFKNGLNAVSIGSLQLANKELKQYRQEDAEIIKDLNLKLKRVQRISNTATRTKVDISTEVKDSVRTVYVAGTDSIVHDTLHCLEYIDPYLTLAGCIDQMNHFEGLVEYRDTLTQVVHREPHHFWFVKWGTKAIRQEVFSRNPHTFIDFAEYIELDR